MQFLFSSIFFCPIAALTSRCVWGAQSEIHATRQLVRVKAIRARLFPGGGWVSCDDDDRDSSRPLRFQPRGFFLLLSFFF